MSVLERSRGGGQPYMIHTNAFTDKYNDLEAQFDRKHYNIDFLDVNETISELSYLTHNFFRYYGKFPSKVAKYIINTVSDTGSIDVDQDIIFDNYNGSGTTLVEAKIAGYTSGGVDINPFAVLASNVKTYNYDTDKLTEIKSTLFNKLYEIKNLLPDDSGQLTFWDSKPGFSMKSAVKQIYMDFPDIEKWFDTNAIVELSSIKKLLLEMPCGRYREFFVLGFFSIVRRVSKAHDAEVRPHVNKKKKQRNAIDAYDKKITEMISTMKAWNIVTSSTIESYAKISDNSAKETDDFIAELKNNTEKELGLVVSHPPYLNCFDYISVYRLKFLWAFGFDEIFSQKTYNEIKKGEIRSYPASTEKLIENYFFHNLEAYKIIYNQLKPGGYCCVVIGDCTIQKKLFSVHKYLTLEMEKLGFKIDKITYRSTNYGLGKYAYRHKSDYNDNENGKKDAIIFFKK